MSQTLVFRLALDPSPAQEQSFSSHVGAVRYAYNWALNRVTENWAQVREDPNVPYINCSAYSLRKGLNAVKNEVAPWWAENSKEAFATGTANAAAALSNWVKSRNSKSKANTGFPRFKKRYHDTQTGVTFTTGVRRLESSNRHFTFPTVGKVRLHERVKALRWLLSEGGTIANVTVSKTGSRWFAAINIKVEDTLALKYFAGRTKKKARKPSVGVDVGLKVFLAKSDGTFVENPAFLRKSLVRLRKANKRLSRRRKLDKRTGELASARWDKAHQTVLRAHSRIANQRSDFLHKTSKNLVEDYKLIGAESLNIKGMVKNNHLSLSISDAGWGEFTRQLTYKSKRYGSELVQIDRFHPSSKKCSGCGAVKAKLPLTERVYKCDKCGLVIDRDVNAAINIEREAVAQSCRETLNERGEESTGLVTMTSETIPDETLRDASLKPHKAKFHGQTGLSQSCPLP